MISSCGGAGGNGWRADGGGGAGGRIAIYSDQEPTSLMISVNGGIGPDGAQDGEDGTYYWDYYYGGGEDSAN